MNRTPVEIMSDLVAAANDDDQVAVDVASAELEDLPAAPERAEGDTRRTRAEVEADA